MFLVTVLVFNGKPYIAEVLNRYTGEENGEAENHKEKTKSSYVVRTYKSSVKEAANS
jgi:hypothetical protein